MFTQLFVWTGSYTSFRWLHIGLDLCWNIIPVSLVTVSSQELRHPPKNPLGNLANDFGARHDIRNVWYNDTVDASLEIGPTKTPSFYATRTVNSWIFTTNLNCFAGLLNQHTLPSTKHQILHMHLNATSHLKNEGSVHWTCLTWEQTCCEKATFWVLSPTALAAPEHEMGWRSHSIVLLGEKQWSEWWPILWMVWNRSKLHRFYQCTPPLPPLLQRMFRAPYSRIPGAGGINMRKSHHLPGWLFMFVACLRDVTYVDVCNCC